jgi:hypothetical protein
MSGVNEKTTANNGSSSVEAPVEAPPVYQESDIDLPERTVKNRLIRRIDWCIIPLIMLLYLFSFLDRGMFSFALLRRIAQS